MHDSTTIANKVMGLAPLVVLSRGVGFLLIVLIARQFGATGITDSFFIALAITVVLQFIIGTGVGTVATPIMAEIDAKRPDEFTTYISSIALCTAFIGAITALGFASGLEQLLSRLQLLEHDTRALAQWYALALVPYAGFSTTNSVFKATAEIRGRFHWAAIAPLARTGTAILVLVLGIADLEYRVLPLCFVLGGAAEFLLYTVVLTRAGCRPQCAFRLDDDVRRTLRGAAPILTGQSLTAMIPLIDRLFAGSLDVGAVSSLDYADRIRAIPQQFMEFTLVPVAFATWSHGIAKGQRKKYAQQLVESLRLVATLAPPALMGLYIGRYAIISLIFERGLFDAQDTVACAEALSGYLPGLTFLMLGTLAIRAHIVEGRLRWVMAMGAISLSLKCLLNWSLLGYGLVGLTLASSITWFIVPSAHLWHLRDTLDEAVDRNTWWPVIALATVCAVAAGVWEHQLGGPTSATARTLIPAVVLWAVVQGASIALILREGKR